MFRNMFRSKSNFEKVLDKATSNLLLDPDFDSILQLCDMIRGGDVKARDATALIKNHVSEEKNPHVQLLAIYVLDVIMKNCGDEVHVEIINESFLEQLKEIVKSSTSEKVKSKLLEMIQSWNIGFKDQADMKVINNLYNIMKAEGYSFPPITNTPDIFKSEKAPVWYDGEECSKCKVQFGFIQRKHHCRACGGVFCSKCTSRQTTLPKFGIEKQVRVCDSCHYILVRDSFKSSSDLPSEYLNSPLSKQSQEPPKRDETALKEEEELQLAIALSLDQQENKHRIQRERIANKNVHEVLIDVPITQGFVSTQLHRVDPAVDPDLANYLNKSVSDKKSMGKELSVRGDNDTSVRKEMEKKEDVKNDGRQSLETSTDEAVELMTTEKDDEISPNYQLLNTLQANVEIFSNRMKSDKIRGRSIANDLTVQSLFQSINNLHPALIHFMNDLEERRLHQEALQDKLVQLKDARAALNTLRAEHAEKLRQAAEEAERQRQIQMARKLEIMRQKKQEYLSYQRQIALQRMQEQESARLARIEQHKQLIQQRAMLPPMLVAGFNTQYLPFPTNLSDSTTPRQQSSGSFGPCGEFIPHQPGQPQQSYLSLQRLHTQQELTNSTIASTGITPSFQQLEVSSITDLQNMQPITHSYNMSDINLSLPLQSQTETSYLPHQVSVTTSPVTLQATENPKDVVVKEVSDDTNAHQGPQQPLYQQLQQTFFHESTLTPCCQEPTSIEQKEETLISFD